MEYEFSEPPALGTVHEKHGNRYELHQVRPCKRRDGSASFVLVWLGECKGCGEPFLTSQGLKTNSLNRRCVNCHKPLKCATKEARRSRYNGKRRALAKGRAEQRARRELLS